MRFSVLTALVALAFAAGCGSAGTPEPTETTGAPQLDARPVEIVSPTSRRAVPASPGEQPGELAADVTIAGTAEPGTSLLVSWTCAALTCKLPVTADAGGAWQAKANLSAPATKPRLTINAAYDNPAVRGTPATVRVRLRASPGAVKDDAKTATSGRPKQGGSTPPQGTVTIPADEQDLTGTTTQPAPDGGAELDTPATSTIPATGGDGAIRRMIVIGDSLAEGTQKLLPEALSGWQISTDARTGRLLGEGMRILGATTMPDEPTALALSLFTNDDPRHVGALESAVRTSARRAGSTGCAIWATIVRPPVGGVSYRAANAKLESLAANPALSPRLRIVPWAAQVAAHPNWLAPDGVHATSAGYRGRAQLFANAAQSC